MTLSISDADADGGDDDDDVLVVVKIELVFFGVVQLKRLEVDLVPEHSADATEAANILRTLLALVGDDLENGAEILVVVCQPFQERHLLFKLQLHARFLILERVHIEHYITNSKKLYKLRVFQMP